MSGKLKKAMAISAALILGAISFSGFYPDENKNVVHVETYKVRSGDTFWDITRYYRDKDARNLYIFEYQDEVRELNPHLKERHYQLQPNDLIKVRYITRSE